MKPVFLNAMSMITALGNSAETMRGLRAGSTAGLRWRDDLRPAPVCVAEVSAVLPSADAWPLYLRTRNNRLLAASLAGIEDAVRNAIERFGADRVGIVIGSSTSGILEGGAAIARHERDGKFPEGFDYRQQEIGAPSDFLRFASGARGPAFTVSTACTSGAKALAAAARLLQAGICDAVIAGGADSLCPLTVSGFSALESVAASRCNPFSANRDGITIGEGSALFLVTRDAAAVRLAGYGESSDAHHISAPDPSGHGAALAIEAALQRAGVAARDIGYINLHGTATRLNDLMESHVVARVFGSETPCSSTKALLGHTLGAAGAIEAAICWQLLQDNGALPPHAWDGVADSELAPVALVGRVHHAIRGSYAASHSFAFGGSNAVLVLGSDA